MLSRRDASRPSAVIVLSCSSLQASFVEFLAARNPTTPSPPPVSPDHRHERRVAGGTGA